MPASKANIADVFGVAPELIEGEFKIRQPEDPEKARREHEREMFALRLTLWMAGMVLFFAVLLCGMFLHYNRPEQAEKVVATVIGLVGGIGIGRTTLKKE